MRVMILNRPTGGHAAMLDSADVPTPAPDADEVVVRVSVCGVCRTDLDLAEGRLAAPKYPLIPGHQIVGRVVARGRAATRVQDGDRVGIAWIHSACGVCPACRAGNENLCPKFRATGCDTPGGYAEYVTARADFVHAIPAQLNDADAAPLLCAGAIGWRSLRLANLEDGEPLGLTGFGASAHLVLQLARWILPNSPISVFARSPDARAFALELGATWTGDTGDEPPDRLAAIIDTTPAWKPVVEALRILLPGGRLVVNAIRKERDDQDELLQLDYATHLWMEREIKSVANVTRADVRECLALAAEHGIRPTVEELPLDHANDALRAFRSSAVARGARVLRIFAEGSG